MSGSTAELRILITSKDSASQVIKGLGQNLGGLGVAGKVATAAMAGIAVAGGALVAGIGGAVSTAMDFESAMSAVGAVAGASSSELAALSQTALQLGQDTSLAGISASDAAKAMAELASGGISVADIMGGAARGALLLASAGGIDVARAAEIAAAALNNFGLAGSQTGHVADLFAAAANSSAVTVSDLGESLKYIGPLAASMGLSIEEVTAALAEFGDQGIKGSQAGTSLRSILSSLAKPSKQATGLIKELGLEFFDAGGKMKSIAGISEQLKTKLGGLTDQQRANALVTLFGNEALSAATVLYGEGADGIKKYLDQVNVAGSAAANGAKRNDNLKGSIEQLKSSWETLSIVLGTAFIPVVRRVVDGAASIINTIIGLKDTIGPAVAAILQGFKSGDFNNAFGPILAVIDKVFGEGTSGKVALFVSNVLTFVQNLRNGIVAFAGGIASGFGAVLGAIASLVTGQTTLAQFIGGMEIFVSTVLGNLGKLATQAAPYLGQFFSAIGTFIAAAAPQIAAQFQVWAASFVDWIQTTALPWLVPRLQLLLTAIGTWITGTALPAIGAWLVGVGQAFGNWVTTTAIPFLQTNLPLWLTALSTWITGTALPAIGAFVGQIGTAFGGWITATAIPYLQTNLPLWLAALGTWLQGTALPAIGGFLGGIASAFGTWVSEQAVPYLQANLPAWLTALSDWITGTAKPAIAGFMGGLASAMGTWVTEDAIPWLQQKLPEWTAAYLSWAESTGRPAVIAAMKDFGKAMGEWIVNDAIPWVQNELPKWQAAVRDWILGTALPAIGATLLELGKSFGDWVTATAIPYVVANLPGWLAAITGWVLGTALPAILSTMLQVGEAFGQWVATKAIPFVIDQLPAWEHAVSSWLLGTAAPAFRTALLTVGEEFGNWVTTTAVPTVLTKLPEFSSAVVSFLVGTALPAIRGAALQVAIGLVESFIDGVATVNAKLSAALAQLPGIVLSIGGAMYSAGASIIGQLAAGIESAIGQAIAKVQDGLQQIANLLPHSEPKDPQSPLRGLTDAGRMIFTMLGEGISKGAPEAVKAAAEAASSVAKAITDGLAALTALSAFKGGPTGGQVSGFLSSLSDFMEKFITWTGGFEEDVLKAAQTFAQAASAAVGVIKGGVEGLQLLDTFVAPLGASVSGFLSSLADFMEKFSTVAGSFEADVLETSSAFAEGVGKAVGVLSAAVGGLMALANFKAPLEATVSTFLAALADFMERFSTVAGGFEADVLAVSSAFAEGVGKAVGVLGTGVAGLAGLADFMEKFATAASGFESDMLAEASRFATAVGTVVGVIGNGVEGFTKLLTFVAPSQEAIDNFVYAVFEAVRKIAEMASQMSADGIKSAGEFGTAANSVLSALKTGLDVFTGLAKLVVPSAKAIDDFAIAIAYTVARIGTIAEQIGKDGIKKAAEFGASVQSIFGALKSSMDILTNLAKFKDEASKAFDSLQKGLQAAVDLAQGMVNQSKDLVLLSEEYAANMLKAATNFAKGQTVGGMGGEEIGKRLGEGVVSGAQTALDSHSPSQVMAAIGKDVIDGLVQGMSDAQQDAAKKAADVASAVAKALQDSLAAALALGKLDVTKLPGAGQIAAVLGFTATIVDGVRAMAGDLAAMATDEGKALLDAGSKWTEAATKAVGLFSSGLDALAKLATFVAPTQAAILSVGRALMAVINDLAVVAEKVGTEAVDAAAQLADGATKAVSLIGASVDGFLKLSGFTAPLAGVLQFGKALMAAVNDLAIVAEKIDGPTVDAAAKIAEGLGKVAAIVGAGVDGFTKLAGFAFTAPMQAGIIQFDKAIMAFVNDLAIVAEKVTIDAPDVAGRLAEGVGRVVGIVANAVAGFEALDGFAYTEGMRVGILALGKGVAAVVTAFKEITSAVTVEMAAEAGRFADGAGKVLAILANGVAGFKALPEMVAPAAGQIAIFVGAVAELVHTVEWAARLFGTEGLKAASEFADAAGKALGLLGNAKNFEALKDFQAPAESSVTAFVSTVRDLVKRLVAVGQDFAKEGLEAAGLFADAGGKAVSVIGAAVSGFAGLATFVTPGKAAVDGLLATVRYIIARFGEMAQTMSTEGTKQLGDFGTATNAVLGGVKSAIDTFILLDKAVVPKTGDLSDLVVAVQGVTRNMATAAAALGDDAIKDATAFGSAAQGIFTALKSGLDLFILIDKPGSWPTTDWLQPLIELMAGVLLRGGQLLTQSQELKAIADQFSANLMQAGATFGGALGLGDWALTGNLGGGGGASGGGGTTIINNYTVTGNTLLSKDTSTQQAVTGIVTATQGRTIGYATSG